MVLNIQFQVCGFILVLMLIFFFFKKRSLYLTTERIYGQLLIAVAVCIFFDIISIIAINLNEFLKEEIVIFICKAYLLTIVNVAFLILYYTITDIYGDSEETGKKIRRYLIPFAAAVILYFILPIHYYIDGKKIFTYGPSITATYMTAVLYILLSIYYIIRYRGRMNPSRRISIVFLLILWGVTAVLQFMREDWLLVGFSMAVAMVFMYLCLENPESNLDKLTEVFNQTAFYTYLNSLFQRNIEFEVVTIVFQDLKFLNETFGIQNINIFIRDVAEYLQRMTKEKVFRSNGDEFSVIFSNKNDDLKKFVNQILERFDNSWKIGGVNTMIPIIVIDVPGKEVASSSEQVIYYIKYFLEKMKKQKKENYLYIGQEQIQDKRNSGLIEETIRNAIENNDIQVFFQPIYSNEEKKYVSAEALVRIFDKENHAISPEIFIPIAEQNGMILSLGMCVFEKVCQFAKESRIEEYGIQYIEINLSIVQCMQENLAEELIVIMERYNIPPEFINLEITETAAVNSEVTLRHNMDRLISLGATFSLDDYGSGYSNLNYIVGLPFTLVKIDKSLVWSYFETKKAQVAMEFAIAMIKHLGMKIVAEGVETKEQFEKMKELGVDYIQGFYFSKPLAPELFIEELNK